MKNKLIKNTQTDVGLLLTANPYGITLSSLATPTVVTQLVANIKGLIITKKKVGLNDFYLFLPGNPLDIEIVENLARSLLDADMEIAKGLWNEYSMDLKYDIIIPDTGVLNSDIIKKLDLEGCEIRNAFLRKHSILPPAKSSYAYTYGKMTAEDASELVLILKQISSIKPHGKMLIAEFFEEVDIRILYLYAMNEAEQYASDDYDSGAFLQLAMESNDKLPEGVPLLCWLQENVPAVFMKLCGEILNPLWKENRSFFWESWLRQNNPTKDPDYYSKPSAEYNPQRDGIDSEDALDGILKNYENYPE